MGRMDIHHKLGAPFTLSDLLSNSKYSDLQITCYEGTTFAVHKAVVCAQSDFFDRALSSGFRESQTGVIDLSEDCSEIVRYMITFFYTSDYHVEQTRHSNRAGSTRRQSQVPTRKQTVKWCDEDPLLVQTGGPVQHTKDVYSTSKYPSSPMPAADIPIKLEEDDVNGHDHLLDHTHVFSESKMNLIEIHARVYALAEKYCVEGLKALARDKFAKVLPDHIEDEMLAPGLIEAFDSTVDSDRGLRNVVLQLFRENPHLATRSDIVQASWENLQLMQEMSRVVQGLPV